MADRGGTTRNHSPQTSQQDLRMMKTTNIGDVWKASASSAQKHFEKKAAADERAAIAAMARNCPEPIVNEMMEVRAKEVAGLHMADQIRRMLLVFADAVERGDHAQVTEQEDK